MYAKEIIIIVLILIIALLWFSRGKLSDNGDTIDELRDNNRESKSINRETSDIVDKLGSENREARELNRSIRKDNKTAGDIIAEVRKQKLDR